VARDAPDQWVWSIVDSLLVVTQMSCDD